MDHLLSILAQNQPAQPTQPAPGALPLLLPALLMAMIVFMFLSARSQKKREQREREQMYAALKRNDRVLTVGGVIGTILSIKDDQVVLKVDESTNTKMTFVKSAVQRILSEDAADTDR